MSAPTECSRETKVYYQNCARGTPTDDLVRLIAHTTPVSDVISFSSTVETSAQAP